MSTRLSIKMARMSLEELAMEYQLKNTGSCNYDTFSLMSMSLYAIKEEMIRRTGRERTEQLLQNARQTLQMIMH